MASKSESAIGEGTRPRLVPFFGTTGPGFGPARAALLLVALATVTPNPLSRLWGTMVLDRPTWVGGGFAGWLLLFGAVEWWHLRQRCAAGRRGRAAVSSTIEGVLLCLDCLFLTLVLYGSGSAENPFTLLYFIPLSLSTLVSRTWTFRVALSAVFGFAVLFADSAAGVDLSSARGHFLRHVLGMAVALGFCGGLLTIFFHRIAGEIDEQRRHIAELSMARERDRLATSLGAIAAGAAHELGTPLGTIQLVVDDFAQMSGQERENALITVRDQVQRMKRVLHDMDAVTLSADVRNQGLTGWALSQLQDELPAEVVFRVAEEARRRTTDQPRRVIGQIIRELIHNADRAVARGGATVGPEVEVDADARSFRVSVLDRGPGFLSQEIGLAFQPFWSGDGGRGLGLFLAEVHARQLGGSLEIEARSGGGTVVRLRLPMELDSFFAQAGSDGARDRRS